MRPGFLLAGVCLAACLIGGEAVAQAAAPQADTQALLAAAVKLLKDDPAKDAALFDFSFGAPESPVLPLVGVQGDQITKVESFRKFGAAVLTGSDAAGAGKAIGIDFSPYWLISRGPVSLETYRQFSGLQRDVARAKSSIALAEGDKAKGIPSSLVVSFSTKLLSSQDPLKDNTFEKCIKDGPVWQLADRIEAAGAAALPPGNDPGAANAAWDEAVTKAKTAVKADLEKAYNDCVKSTATVFARRASLDVGGGFRLNGKPGSLEGLSGSGEVIWATFATGVVGNDDEGGSAFSRTFPGLQFRGVAHARYTFSEDTFDTTGMKTGSANSLVLVGGIESVPGKDGGDRLHWALQGGWNKQDAPNPTTPEKDYWRYLALAQYKVLDGVWLNGTVGRVEGKGVQSDTYLSIGITFSPPGGTTGIQKFYEQTRY